MYYSCLKSQISNQQMSFLRLCACALGWKMSAHSHFLKATIQHKYKQRKGYSRTPTMYACANSCLHLHWPSFLYPAISPPTFKVEALRCAKLMLSLFLALSQRAPYHTSRQQGWQSYLPGLICSLGLSQLYKLPSRLLQVEYRQKSQHGEREVGTKSHRFFKKLFTGGGKISFLQWSPLGILTTCQGRPNAQE